MVLSDLVVLVMMMMMLMVLAMIKIETTRMLNLTVSEW
jgi:hypothetical protein